MNKKCKTTEKYTPEFEQEVVKYIDLVFSVAFRLTRNREDAEDLTQSTMVKAFRFHEQFEKGTNLKAWLLTILRNTFINEFRKKSKEPTKVELLGNEPAKSSSPDTKVPGVVAQPDEYEHLLELLDDPVRKALDSLPTEFRIAVIMSDLQDYSYKEIADVMKCPIGTVMSRLFRGRRLIREYLERIKNEPDNPPPPTGTRLRKQRSTV
ncbi:MAG: sigma-70 family RNA polymerase sigma factor [Candidatus Hydrogenedens sp.]